jgi:hypothetical protein
MQSLAIQPKQAERDNGKKQAKSSDFVATPESDENGSTGLSGLRPRVQSSPSSDPLGVGKVSVLLEGEECPGGCSHRALHLFFPTTCPTTPA